MKALFIRLFAGQNVISRISALLAALVASAILSYLPGLPEVATIIVGFLLELPEGSEITQQALVASLTPLIMLLISETVKHFIGKDNNVVLETLKEAGVYTGELDTWVGPAAQAGIDALIEGNKRQ